MTVTRHPSLEQAFVPQTPVNRGEALAGLLPPRRPVAPTSETAPQPDGVPEHTHAAVAPPRRARASSSRPVADVGEGARLVNVAIYLPPATLAAARAAIREQETTYADLLVEAFARIDDDDLKAQFRPLARPTTESGMPRRTPRTRGVAGIQRQFRLTAGQREWLQSKVTYFGAPSRSALAATVLSLHFQTHDR